MKRTGNFKLRQILYLVFGVIILVAADKPLEYMKWPKGFVYVPNGKVQLEKEHTVKEFWMQSTEVSNEEYLRYLDDLKANGMTKEYHLAFPDSAKLKSEMWIYNYMDYISSKMFSLFPVVGITAEQAADYAIWYTNYYESQHPNTALTFRLPGKAEWIQAAKGGNSGPFSFSGDFTRNSKGCELFHYFNLEQRFAIYGDSAGKHEILTAGKEHPYYLLEWNKLFVNTKSLKKNKRKRYGKALPLIGIAVPVDSYFPNNYGLYNVCGNVAEFVIGDSTEILGGSYRTSSEYCRLQDGTTYPFKGRAFSDVGFRLACSPKSAN